MPRVHVFETALVDATPAQVYGVFADYVNHHPNVLPTDYFTSCTVTEGGYGAGTKIHVEMQAFGVKNQYDMAVTEPVPGQVLVESDLNSSMKTTFTVTPGDNPQQTLVRIETDWERKKGLAGLIDRLTTPPIMRMIYRKELNKLKDYLRQQAKSA